MWGRRKVEREDWEHFFHNSSLWSSVRRMIIVCDVGEMRLVQLSEVFWPPCVSINVQHVSLLLHVSVDTASGELQVGDRIIEVNGEPVEDKSLAEVSAFHAALSKAVSTLFTAQMT